VRIYVPVVWLFSSQFFRLPPPAVFCLFPAVLSAGVQKFSLCSYVDEMRIR